MSDYLSQRLKNEQILKDQQRAKEDRKTRGGASGEDYMEDEKQKPSTFTGRNGKPRKRSK